MAIDSVNTITNAYAGAPQQSAEARQARQTERPEQESRPVETQERREEPPRPVKNAEGQTTGTVVNTTA